MSRRPQSARTGGAPRAGQSRPMSATWAAPSNRGAMVQALNLKKTQPDYGFGSATREQVSKLFVSQEHTALATAGTHSPGPALYHLPPSVGGKQPDGRKRDPPVWRFGTTPRFQYGGKLEQVPGPQQYTAVPSVGGKQPEGSKQDPPVWSFGTAERKDVRKCFVSRAHQKTDFYGMHSPGPAKYLLPASVGGKQADGRKRDPPSWTFSSAIKEEKSRPSTTPGPIYNPLHDVDTKFKKAPSPGFGASTRDVRAMVFISQEHEKGSHGLNTPGPAAPYALPAAVGYQISSKKRTSPRCSFPKESRWRAYEKEISRNSTPGPGAY